MKHGAKRLHGRAGCHELAVNNKSLFLNAFSCWEPSVRNFCETQVFSQEYERTVDDFVTARAHCERPELLIFRGILRRALGAKPGALPMGHLSD